MEEKLKVYVGKSDTAPIVGVTTNKHRKFTAESLQVVLRKVNKHAMELRTKWDNSNWFPCGFVNLNVESRSALVKFIKKNGKKDGNFHSFENLEIMKAYNSGYHLYFRFEQQDAITAQCMNYKMDVYQYLMKELAFLYITTSLESRID